MQAALCFSFFDLEALICIILLVLLSFFSKFFTNVSVLLLVNCVLFLESLVQFRHSFNFHCSAQILFYFLHKIFFHLTVI